MRRRGDRETKTGVLTHIADMSALGKAAPAVLQDGLHSTVPLRLSHQITPAGEVVVDICGELDIATAEQAVRYVRHLIDRYHGPVIADLAALAFCDASGLGALVRMARYSEQADRSFGLAFPRPSLVKIMRITGLDRRLPDAIP